MAVEPKALHLSPNTTSIFKRHVGVKQVCRWCEQTVDEEVWATAIDKNGITMFMCDYCGKRVGHDTLLAPQD